MTIVHDRDLHIYTHVEELVGGQVSRAHLQPVDVHVDHGVAEVGLNVCHGLAFDLQAVSYPHTRQDLVEQALWKKFSLLV